MKSRKINTEQLIDAESKYIQEYLKELVEELNEPNNGNFWVACKKLITITDWFKEKQVTGILTKINLKSKLISIKKYKNENLKEAPNIYQIIIFKEAFLEFLALAKKKKRNNYISLQVYPLIDIELNGVVFELSIDECKESDDDTGGDGFKVKLP